MNALFEIAAGLSTPLALGGFIAAALFFIFRQVLSLPILANLARKETTDIIKQILLYLFVLSLVAMVLGFAGYVVKILADPQRTATATTMVIDADPAKRNAKIINYDPDDSAYREESIQNVERLHDPNRFRVTLKPGYSEGWFMALHMNMTDSDEYFVKYFVDRSGLKHHEVIRR